MQDRPTLLEADCSGETSRTSWSDQNNTFSLRSRARRRSGTVMESCSVTHQPSLRFDKWSVDAVHFVVKPTGVTQVVAGTVSPPQGGRHGPTVDTLSSFSKVIEKV